MQSLFLLKVSFFFQAEDGIRAGHVTGVQTCALPILAGGMGGGSADAAAALVGAAHLVGGVAEDVLRSEERRVGKEGRSLRSPFFYGNLYNESMSVRNNKYNVM